MKQNHHLTQWLPVSILEKSRALVMCFPPNIPMDLAKLLILIESQFSSLKKMEWTSITGILLAAMAETKLINSNLIVRVLFFFSIISSLQTRSPTQGQWPCDTFTALDSFQISAPALLALCPSPHGHKMAALAPNIVPTFKVAAAAGRTKSATCCAGFLP